jgi:hypothetical protein
MTSEERKAKNEAVFRDANEAIRREQVQLGLERGSMPFVCECEDETCRTVILLEPAAYEAARADPRTFLIASGHPSSGGELLEEHEGYCLVKKTGVSAAVAEATNPRSRSDGRA